MGAKKFSAVLALLLLIISVVGIFIVIYSTSSPSPSSPNRRIEESFMVHTKWESKASKSQPSSISEVREQVADKQPDKVVTNRLERILSSDQRKRDSVGSRETTTVANPRSSTDKRNESVEDKPEVLQTKSFVHQVGEVQSTETTPQMSWNEFSPSPLNPWLAPKVNLRGQLNRRILSPGDSQKMVTLSNQAYTAPPYNHRPPYLQPMAPVAGPISQSNIESSYESFQASPQSSQEISEEDQYGQHDSAIDDEAGEAGELQGIDVGELFDLASNLYASGTNTSDLQGFLQVLNDTMNKGNNSDMLVHLNELYSRPPVVAAEYPHGSVGRNAYETSLTAFVFMSFGVFLLNQIHNFIAKDSITGRNEEGRLFPLNSLQGSMDEESNLDILFNPPPLNWTEGLTKFNSNRIETGSGNSSASSSSSSSSSSSNSFINSSYVNNMFRALLNLINAYTKNSQALECIWSLYCQDLDQTAGKQGLYGIAARINSIGLRLIMDQIPAELTLDVMLRSLLGWDGLPCTKMFPKCQKDNAVLTLQTATSGNSPSP